MLLDDKRDQWWRVNFVKMLPEGKIEFSFKVFLAFYFIAVAVGTFVLATIMERARSSVGPPSYPGHILLWAFASCLIFWLPICMFFEWWLHRHLMHTNPVLWGRVRNHLHEKHDELGHHGVHPYEPRNGFSYPSRWISQMASIHFPSYALPLFWLIFNGLLANLVATQVAKIGGRDAVEGVQWGAFAAAAIGYGVYEPVHALQHKPGFWVWVFELLYGRRERSARYLYGTLLTIYASHKAHHRKKPTFLGLFSTAVTAVLGLGYLVDWLMGTCTTFTLKIENGKCVVDEEGEPVIEFGPERQPRWLVRGIIDPLTYLLLGARH